MTKRKAGVFDDAISILEDEVAWTMNLNGDKQYVQRIRTAIRVLKILNGAKVQRFGRMGNGLDIKSDGLFAALLIRARKLHDRNDVKKHTKGK